MDRDKGQNQGPIWGSKPGTKTGDQNQGPKPGVKVCDLVLSPLPKELRKKKEHMRGFMRSLGTKN